MELLMVGKKWVEVELLKLLLMGMVWVVELLKWVVVELLKLLLMRMAWVEELRNLLRVGMVWVVVRQLKHQE